MDINAAVARFKVGVEERKARVEKKRSRLEWFRDQLKPLVEAGAPLTTDIRGGALCVTFSVYDSFEVRPVGEYTFSVRRKYDTSAALMSFDSFLDIIVPVCISRASI